jgi:Domain amino terminal to FKBP-type peptidyl-prolyl isomerase
MKRFLHCLISNPYVLSTILINALFIGILPSCSDEDAPEPYTINNALKDKQDSVSYFIGMKMSAKFKKNEPNFKQLDLPLLMNGFKQFLNGDTALQCRNQILETAKQSRKTITNEDIKGLSFCFGKINAYECLNVFKGFNAHQNISKSTLIKGFEDGIYDKNNLIDADQSWIYTYEQFITQCNMENEKRLFQKAYENKSISQLDSNVLLEIISPGQGDFINPLDEVTFNFVKYNALGDTLETSFQSMGKSPSPRKAPFQSLEKGLQIGFLKMKPGGKYRLFIPGKLTVLDNQRYQAFSYEIDLIASTKKGTFVENSPY